MAVVKAADQLGCLLRSRRPDTLMHDCPLPSALFQLQGVPLMPSQLRVLFRLPQCPWSSRPFNVLQSGVTVPGLTGTDSLEGNRPFCGVTFSGVGPLLLQGWFPV